MPVLENSSLARFTKNLVEHREGKPVTIPSRLALNEALKAELDLSPHWFYDRTFPLWAAGKAMGLAFQADVNSNNQSAQNRLLLGNICALDGGKRELQLLGLSMPTKSDETPRCLELPCAVIETVAGEFCHHMGISSARILCVITDNSSKVKDDPSPCTLATRVARSFLNQGHLINASATDSREFQELLDYLINEYFFIDTSGAAEKPYEQLLHVLCNTSLKAAAKWQASGFYHGKLSSHSLTISGETMDFQQSGFISTLKDNFRLFNGATVEIEHYHHQPQTVIDLCGQLHKAFIPLLPGEADDKNFTAMLHNSYNRYFCEAIHQKLGVGISADPKRTIEQLLRLLNRHQVDYFYFYDRLTNSSNEEKLFEHFARDPDFTVWFNHYQQAKASKRISTAAAMGLDKLNPSHALRSDKIDAVVTALRAGNRNALENVLETIQQQRPLSVNQWAS